MQVEVRARCELCFHDVPREYEGILKEVLGTLEVHESGRFRWLTRTVGGGTVTIHFTKKEEEWIESESELSIDAFLTKLSESIKAGLEVIFRKSQPTNKPSRGERTNDPTT
jgi:hypothetical protein